MKRFVTFVTFVKFKHVLQCSLQKFNAIVHKLTEGSEKSKKMKFHHIFADVFNKSQQISADLDEIGHSIVMFKNERSSQKLKILKTLAQKMIPHASLMDRPLQKESRALSA